MKILALLFVLMVLLASSLMSFSIIKAETLILGTVTDSISNPIENAIVTPAPSFFRADTTDSSGFFSLAGYPPGTYNIGFTHFDYFDTALYEIQLAQDETITVDVSMRHRPTNDVAAVRFLVPRSGIVDPVHEYTTYQPSVEVRNIGLQSVSFSVYYEIYSVDSASIIVADTLSIEIMPANSLDTVTFSRPFTLPPDFPYSLISFTSLVGDENHLNDSCRIAGITARDFFIIFGNKDSSVMPVHNNQNIEIPVWGGTPREDYMDSIGYMHIPLASDDNIISQRNGGYFPDTLVGRWDDKSFLSPENHEYTPEIPVGYTSQSILGFAYLSEPRDEQNFFNTDGDTVLIATYKMRVTSDSAIIGDTVQPFITGYDNANGGLYWGDVNVLWGWVPRVSFSSLYIQSLAEWGCDYTPGDINVSGVTNGLDIVYAVNYLRGTGPVSIDCNPPCTDLSDPFYAAMDVNGSCTVNGIDITYLVSYLKGGAALRFCPSCPPAGE